MIRPDSIGDMHVPHRPHVLPGEVADAVEERVLQVAGAVHRPGINGTGRGPDAGRTRAGHGQTPVLI